MWQKYYEIMNVDFKEYHAISFRNIRRGFRALLRSLIFILLIKYLGALETIQRQ